MKQGDADSKAYANQILQMIANGRTWLMANPNREIKVQFNFSRKVFLIAPISAAIEQHYVSTNEAGLALLKSLWNWDASSEPTVAMCRIVIEELI